MEQNNRSAVSFLNFLNFPTGTYISSIILGFNCIVECNVQFLWSICTYTIVNKQEQDAKGTRNNKHEYNATIKLSSQFLEHFGLYLY